MSHQLVAKEIEVYPTVRLTTGGAAENAAVKTAGSFQVGYWESQMKTGVNGVCHGSKYIERSAKSIPDSF